jgi:glycerol-3-phosphate dehydrogenase
MNDFLGNEIKPNCKIAYACRRGSRLWLSTMTVTSVSGGKVTGYKPDGRRTFVKNLATVIVVPDAPAKTVSLSGEPGDNLAKYIGRPKLNAGMPR